MTQNHYKKMYDLELDRAKVKIQNTLKEVLDSTIISEKKLKAMDPDDKQPCQFYCNFKIHKQHTHFTTPPPRPIISGSGSITENIGIYVDNQIHEFSTQHNSYLQDTPHFLRIIHKINQGPQEERAHKKSHHILLQN